MVFKQNETHEREESPFKSIPPKSERMREVPFLELISRANAEPDSGIAAQQKFTQTYQGYIHNSDATVRRQFRDILRSALEFDDKTQNAIARLLPCVSDAETITPKEMKETLTAIGIIVSSSLKNNDAEPLNVAIRSLKPQYRTDELNGQNLIKVSEIVGQSEVYKSEAKKYKALYRWALVIPIIIILLLIAYRTLKYSYTRK